VETLSILSPGQQAAVDAMDKYPTKRAAAASLGIHETTFHEHLSKARKKLAIDPGITGRLAELGIADLGGVHSAWVELRDKDGKKAGNAYVQMGKEDHANALEEIERATDSAIERISTAAPTAPSLIRVKPADGSLFGLLPLFDAHIGLSMPGYGLDEAVARMVSGAFEAIDAMPAAGCIAIINGGDMTHQNDDSNQTPQSRHPLPISANYLDTTDSATDARIAIVEHAAKKFDRVETKDLIGNHDPATAKIIRAAMRQRYRDHDNIHVDLDGVEFWHMKFGQTLLSVHHGDIRRSLKDMALALCQRYRTERGLSKFHEHHTGHLHHIKETRFDLGGVHFCQHAAISRKSNYDAANIYESDSILQGITYRESGGRKSTVEVHLE